MSPRLAFVCLLLAGCGGPQGQLASLAAGRLALAPQIAWYKHSRGLPVYDPGRESSTLRTVMNEGERQGVDPETVRRFFAAEMEASRRIQWTWIEVWRKGLAPEPESAAPDLAAQLRPQIDEINARQIRALARGARPLTADQLSAIGARFLPKN